MHLDENPHPSKSAGRRFRELLRRPGILKLPGAHNGMVALQARAAGFKGLYLSGAAMTASMGLPDLSIITVDEVCFFIRQVVRASGLPLLVDADTGYGEALNVMHAVRVFEEAGAGALHLEDQFLPKKCGHLNDKKLVEAHDMATKVHAAAKARRDLVIVARTDAAASEGLDGAVARAKVVYGSGCRRDLPGGAQHGGDVPCVRDGGTQKVRRSDADARRALRDNRIARLRGARCFDCPDHYSREDAAAVASGSARRIMALAISVAYGELRREVTTR